MKKYFNFFLFLILLGIAFLACVSSSEGSKSSDSSAENAVVPMQGAPAAENASEEAISASTEVPVVTEVPVATEAPVATEKPEAVKTPVVDKAPQAKGPTVEGEFRMLPVSQNVSVGNPVVINISLNSGTKKVAAYGIEVIYDSAVLKVNTETGTSGVTALKDGFVSAVNAAPGTGVLVSSGFDVAGKGPSTEMEFLSLNFTAIGKGHTDLVLIKRSLVSPSYENIGGEAQGDQVSVTVK